MDEKFLNIVAGVLKTDVKKLKEDSTTESVPEWDSLNHWTVVGKLEEAYGVGFTLEEATGFRNLGHIYEILLSKKQE